MRWRSCAFWPVARGAAQLEQLALAVDDARRLPDRSARASSSSGNLIASAPSRSALEARLARAQFVQALGDDREVGARHRVVEPHHDVAGLDAVAVAHAHFADDAAGRVLHLLDVGIDHDRARRDQRAGQLGGRRPSRRRRRPARRRSATPASMWRLDRSAAIPRSGCRLMTAAPGFRHDLERRAARLGALQHLGQHLVLRAECLHAALRS